MDNLSIFSCKLVIFVFPNDRSGERKAAFGHFFDLLHEYRRARKYYMIVAIELDFQGKALGVLLLGTWTDLEIGNDNLAVKYPFHFYFIALEGGYLGFNVEVFEIVHLSIGF